MGTQLQPYNTGYGYGGYNYNNNGMPPRHSPPNRRVNSSRSWWRGFFIASLIYWVIILFLAWAWTSYQESQTVTQVKMCIVVDKDPIIHEVQLPVECKPAPKPAPVRQPQPRPAPPPPPVSTPAPAVRSVPAAAAPPPPPAQIPESASRFLQSYIDKLRARIRATRVYPPLSIQRRQEGNALVGFNIIRDGSIKDINIVESSGYPPLDESALNALHRVSPFESYPTRDC